MVEDDETEVEYEWNNEEEKREVRGLPSTAPIMVGVDLLPSSSDMPGGLVSLLVAFTMNQEKTVFQGEE